jgi:hypothetical protein
MAKAYAVIGHADLSGCSRLMPRCCSARSQGFHSFPPSLQNDVCIKKPQPLLPDHYQFTINDHLPTSLTLSELYNVEKVP